MLAFSLFGLSFAFSITNIFILWTLGSFTVKKPPIFSVFPVPKIKN